MPTALYLPPHVTWFDSLIGSIKSQIVTCGDFSELDKYPDHYKIVVDNLDSTESGIGERVAEYQKTFDKIIVVNSETPINILEQCQSIDVEQVELLITGKVNYTPKHMKIFRHENFFTCVQYLYNSLTVDPLAELTPYTTKPYYFDALLGLEKPVRNWISDQIDQNCSDKIFKTYYRNSDQLATLDNKHFAWTPGVEVISTPVATSNTIRYYGQETWISHVVPVEIYNQCAYTIISETYDDNTFSFFTEKTAKPLLSRRLFVMFAGAHYLRNLRELGFRTFDGIIDESYDQEPDEHRRFQMAFDQVMYLCNQDQRRILDLVQPIAEHNYKLFTETNWHQENLELICQRITQR